METFLALQRRAVGQEMRGLQSAVGNRAMGRLLARLHDPGLAASDSVVVPPVMWVKYPPSILTMSRVELFDAIELISEWLEHRHTRYVGELEALRERLRARARQVTTPVEYRTFSRYVRMPVDLLRQAYAGQVQKVVTDRRVYSVVSFDAIDEVVHARLPGAQWPTAARAWLTSYLHEEDRRSERFAKFRLYERASFEKFEAQAKHLDEPGAELWRELAWSWIELSDEHQDREAIEGRLIDGLAGLYEQLLREVDALIQQQCGTWHPQTWAEKAQANLSKAWGDPCKPWFGPDGTHGPDEVKWFKTKLRLDRADDPFACVYDWVEEFLKFKRLLTDPKAQLEALNHRAVGALFVHWATIAPQVAAQATALGESLVRSGAKFLQHSMVGFRIELADLGSVGAGRGGPGSRPAITAVSPSGPAGARPPILRGPDVPDLPAQSPPLRAQAPAGVPVADRPTGSAPAAASTATRGREPATIPPKWTPPSPPQGLPEAGLPPAFVKARDLGYASEKNDPTVVATLRGDIVRVLSTGIGWGTDDKSLPPGWKAMWKALKSALKRNTDNASKQVLAVLDVVWAALRNPELYADVIVAAWRRAMTANTSIDTQLIATAGAKASDWIPRHLAEWLLDNPGAFFDLYASRPRPFVDMPLLGDSHRALAHLIQDLVVDLAFKRANINMTSAQFRELLGKIEGTITPNLVPGGPDVRPHGAAIALGDFLWQLTYDLNVLPRKELPQPEAFADALHDLLNIQ